MVSADTGGSDVTGAEILLRRSAEQIASFAHENLAVGLVFASSAREAPCLCGLHPDGNGHGPGCRSFAEGLGGNLRQRCPEGLQVVARRIPRNGAEPLLLASQGFLVEGERNPTAAGTSAGRRKGSDIPRLSAEGVRLLEEYIGMGAGLLEGIARLESETTPADDLWRDLLGEPTLVGVSPAIRALRESLPSLANSREPLFIDAESGTGHRLLAAAVHRLGSRGAGPFIVENLSAIPEELHETEIFGTEQAPGLIAQASGGTLFLSGVDRLNSTCQERLLALISGDGGGRSKPRANRLPDVRVISSAQSGVGDAVRRGRIHRGLMARLQTLSVSIPPLRDRPEDIPLVAERLLRRRAAAEAAATPTVESEALEALSRYSWPDNIRGLDAELAQAGNGRTVIGLGDLSGAVQRAGRSPFAGGRPDLRQAVGELEAGLISRTLGETNWNKSRAARILGLSRLGLQKKIDRYAIDRRR